MEKRIAKKGLAVDFRIKEEKIMISVAMATYNGEKYILEQLESICKQTVKVDEIVIVDDCSQDSTVALIKDFIDRHSTCNIRFWENEKNLGYKKNFHKALSLCEGEIIFLSDQDDIWKEHKVETLWNILKEHEEISLISSSFMYVDGQGNKNDENRKVYKKKIRSNELVSIPIEDLLFHNISQGCSMAIKKEVKDVYLEHFTEELPHDRMLNVIASLEKKCYYLNDPLFYYRIHDNNTIGLNEGLTWKEKNTYPVRLHDSEQAFEVIRFIKNVDKEFYKNNMSVLKAEVFVIRHNKNLRRKNWVKLIFQNFNPLYWKLKTVRGRLLDIVFCFSNAKLYEEEEE